MRTKIFLSWALFLFLFIAFPFGRALADNPQVISFSVNPSYASYGLTTTLSWSVSNSGGVSITVFCPDGITIQNAVTLSSFPCNSETFISQSANDSLALNIINFSGATKNLTARLTPKDIQNQDYGAANKDVSFSIGTSPTPILSFAGPSSVPSGLSATFNWTSHDIPGVNFIFGCYGNITVPDPSNSGQNLSCGSVAFSSNQNASGSLTVTMKNNSDSSSTMMVSIIPAISATSYDSVHGQQVSVEVGPKPSPIVPFINAFTASDLGPTAEIPVSFSWTTSNAAGVNMIFGCGPSVSVFSYSASSTAALPCGSVAFSQSLGSTGSTTVIFKNSSTVSQYETVSLVTGTSGYYDATKAAKLNLVIRPVGWQVFSTINGANTAPPAAGGASGTAASSNTVVNSAGQAIFNRVLDIGSRGNDVTSLQNYFLKDSKNYPGALVTGYFGSLTKKFVKTFQAINGIANPGDAGYGSFGPKTRAKLNLLILK